MLNKDEIIRMAREAGFNESGCAGIIGVEDFLGRFAALVAAHEREACANLVETTHATGLQSIREACAAAIRART